MVMCMRNERGKVNWGIVKEWCKKFAMSIIPPERLGIFPIRQFTLLSVVVSILVKICLR
jgi:hypothetical protein